MIGENRPEILEKALFQPYKRLFLLKLLLLYADNHGNQKEYNIRLCKYNKTGWKFTIFQELTGYQTVLKDELEDTRIVIILLLLRRDMSFRHNFSEE